MAQLIGFEPMHRYNRPSGLANHPLYHLSTVAYMVREPRLELRIRVPKTLVIPISPFPNIGLEYEVQTSSLEGVQIAY